MNFHSNRHTARLAAVMVTLAVAMGVGAETPLLPGRAVIGDLELRDDHVLEVDGVEVAAEIHYSRYEMAWCLSSPALETPLILSPRGRSVQRIVPGKLRRGAGLTSQLAAAAAGEYVGEYREHDGVKTFEVDGRTVRLVPRPPLVGSRSADDLRRRHQRYGHHARAYRPTKAVDAKRFPTASGHELTVRVYLGSWSKACERMVPRILRLEDDLRRRVRFEYVGLSRPLTHDPTAREAGIYSLPTAVVLVDGVEVARLAGRPLDTPEKDLYEMLSRYGA